MLRKSTCVILLFLACFLLYSCGKSEAVISVEEQISQIGSIDEFSKITIDSIETQYEALSDSEKKKVENYADLQEAQKEYDNLIASKVVARIDEIGEVTKDSYPKIKSAAVAYDELLDEQKQYVTNYDILESAETKYNTLLISEVEDLIRKVQYTGDSEPTPTLKSDIETAQKAYNELDEELKPMVRNYKTLETTNQAISSFYINRAQEAINSAIETNSNYQAADEFYKALTDEQKKKISNYEDFSNKYAAYKNTSPIELVNYALKTNSIKNPEIYISAKNISGQIIKEFSMTVFAFDDDGIPVSVYFGDYAKGLNYSTAIKPDESTKSNTYWTLYGDFDSMKQVVVIIRKVEFFDGSSWENSQYDTLYSKYEQQLLPAGDANVLPRR